MKPLKTAALLSCLFLSPLVARADVALFFGNYSLRIDQQTTFGWSFTLTSPLLVTDLGYFDLAGDGLTDSHQVAIWMSIGGSPLVFGTVPGGSGATLLNSVRYVPVNPTLLLPGTYTIGGYSPNFTDAVANNDTSITTAPGIIYNGSRSAQGIGLMFPPGDTQGYVNGDFGPNFQFSAIPEPSTFAMLAAGSALLVGNRVSRRRKARRSAQSR